MTPERREEIDAMIAWWNQISDWRVNGFNIECNDPLFKNDKKRKKDVGGRPKETD